MENSAPSRQSSAFCRPPNYSRSYKKSDLYAGTGAQ